MPDDANRPIQVWLKDHGVVGSIFLYLQGSCL